MNTFLSIYYGVMGTRTPNPLRAKQVLYQLTITPNEDIIKPPDLKVKGVKSFRFINFDSINNGFNLLRSAKSGSSFYTNFSSKNNTARIPFQEEDLLSLIVVSSFFLLNPKGPDNLIFKFQFKSNPTDCFHNFQNVFSLGVLHQVLVQRIFKYLRATPPIASITFRMSVLTKFLCNVFVFNWDRTVLQPFHNLQESAVSFLSSSSI